MFPNPRMPVHAQFVKQRLDALSRRIDLSVVSPIPWFPGEQVIAKYKNRHRVPSSTSENRYPTSFPRFLSIPSIFKPMDGLFMASAVRSWVLKHYRPTDFDLIDCHLGFPDGFAGALLARIWRMPFTVTLRGHDINDLYRFPVRVRQVLFALRHCSRYFGVSQALVDGAVQLGAPKEKGFRSANGVDPNRFFPIPRHEARIKLGIDPNHQYIITVSHIVKRKGIDILMRALSLLKKRGHSQLRYILAGSGGEEGDYTAELRKLADALGISEYIIWVGAVDNANLHWYYSAADVSCLASAKEGWPNVILESLACGTPAIAYATWGVPEIIPNDDIGILVKERTPDAFADAIARGLDKFWNTEAIVHYAKEHSWERTADELCQHLTTIAGRRDTRENLH